jgi:hypothetical protein
MHGSLVRKHPWRTIGVVPVLMAAGFLAGPITAHADTLSTCDTSLSATNCKTVTTTGSTANGGNMTNPTSGTITFTGLTPGTTYNVEDVLQALPVGQNTAGFYTGTYTLAFTSCTAGSGIGSTYTVTSATGSYPSSPPTTSGTLPTITASDTGTVSCNYTLTFTVTSPTLSGSIASTRNDFFVLNQLTGAVVTQVASMSVGPPPNQPPVVIPESPLAAIILPLSGLAVLGFGLVLWRRRAGSASQPVS